jgi:hypothetical protein
MAHADANVAALQARLDAPLIVRIAYAAASAAQALAPQFDIDALR